jgi:hypothetical protein
MFFPNVFLASFTVSVNGALRLAGTIKMLPETTHLRGWTVFERTGALRLPAHL